MLTHKMEDFILSEKVYRQLKSMVSFLVPTRQGIKLSIHTEGGSFTDNKRIVLGLPEIYHERSREEMFSALFALVGHESQHINSSDFESFKRFIEDTSARFFDACIPQHIGAQVAKGVMNGIEDGRIERILCHKMPGMLKHIKSLNSVFWMEQPITKDTPQLQAFIHAIVVLATSGVYPRNFEKVYGDAKTMAILNQAKPVIKRGVQGNHFRDCELASNEVIDIIFDYVVELFESDPMASRDMEVPDVDFSETEETEAGTNTSLPTHFFEDDNDTSTEDGQDTSTEDGQDASSQEEKGQPGNMPGETDGTTNEASDEQTTEDVERLIQTKFQEMKREAEEEAKQRIGSKKKDKEVIYDTVLTPEEIRDIEQLSITGTTSYREERLHRSSGSLSPALKQKGKRLHKELENLFRNKTAVNVHGQRRGKLYANDLYRIKTKDYHVFTKQGTPVTTDYVAYILQDGSGSMTGANYQHAMEAQMIIEEGLKGLIPFKSVIYNGSSDEDQIISHYPIKDWKDTSTSRNYAEEAYRAYEPEEVNQDGASIRFATHELLKRPEKDRLLFVLSDGLPYVMQDLLLGVKDTKEAVKEAKAKGIHVILIAFGDKEFRDSHIANYRTMYQRNIISCETHMIGTQLTKQLKNILKL